MKKICIILSLLLLLAGCSNAKTQNNSKLISFDVYAINDLHGKIADTAFQPGVDELSTYLKNAQEAGNTIILATGDMWQGASESNLTGGLIVTDWMNKLNFTAMTMGGHEYDWGEEQIRENKKIANFPFLAINIYSRKTNEQVDYCQSSVMAEIEGAKIGIIGAIGDCYYSIASENTKDVYFKTGDELTALVKAESQNLREAGADFIIYTLHDGYDQSSPDSNAIPVKDEIKDYYNPILSDGYVDLVFEADSHYTYKLEDSHGVYHLQAGANNSGISHASVLIDKTKDEIYVFTAETVPSSKYIHLNDDLVVDELLEKYEDQIAPSTRILGNNAYYRGSEKICQLVADLYAAKGEEKWGKEYNIVLGGGYISCRSPMYLSAGEVSYSQLMSLLPFDNQITLCSIKGKDLISRFLKTDNKAYYIKTTAFGERTCDNIDPDAIYYVVTDTYSANYSYNNMTIVDTLDDDVFARDLVADYILAGGLEQ